MSYQPSLEHKDQVTAAGLPKLRSDASPCPRHLDLATAEALLRDAVARGQVSASLEGGFPRYAWVEHEGQCFEARLTNSGLGTFKGYPLDDDERPTWLT